MLSTIGQIAIVVHDLAKAVAFYRDVLGIKLLFEVSGMAFFDCDGIRLMLGTAENTEFDHPASIIYFKVSDIRAAHDALAAKGVKFDSPPSLIAKMPDHDLWIGFFRDCENNLMALMSEVREAK